MTTRRAIVALFATGVLACSGDSGPRPAPSIATLRLVVDTTSVLVSSSGAVTAGPLVVSVGDTIEAQFLLDNGQPDPVALTADYRLDATPPSGNAVGLTLPLIRTNRYAAIVGATGTSATPIDVPFALVHIPDGAHPFGPFTVPVLVP